MTEPNKIFRSVCEDIPSYGDISFTRSYKYTMNRVLKTSLCIIGLLCIAFLFMLIGLLLYPYLVGVCKRPVSFEQVQAENGYSGYHLPSVMEILSGSVICEESDHQKSAAKMHLNVSETETVRDTANGTFLNSDECKCPNFSKNGDILSNDIKTGNGTDFLMIGKCVCNETRAIEDFESSKTKDENGNNVIKPLNINEAIQSDSFPVNGTDFVDGRHYLPTNACDCEKARKMNDVSLNGTGGQVIFAEDSECKCPEIFNFDTNKTMPVSEQHEGQFLDSQKCECVNIHKGVILNGTETGSKNFGVKYATGDECICPETVEVEDLISSDAANERINPDIELLSSRNGFETVNFPINEKETVKESILLPSEMIEADAINLNGTGPETDNVDVHSFESNQCECTAIPILNGSRIRSNILGVKNAEGECICFESPDIEDYTTSKITNRIEQSDMESLNIGEAFHSAKIHLNETESGNEGQSLKSDKCICPRAYNTSHAFFNETTAYDENHDIEFEEDIECKCPEILEFGNSDHNKTGSSIEQNLDGIEAPPSSYADSLETQKCECPGMPQMLDNGSRVEGYMLGVKTVDGKCLCLETGNTEDIPVSKIGRVNETEMTNSDETGNAKEKGMPNDDEAKIEKEKEITANDKEETLKENEMANIGEKNYVKEKDIANDDERETVKIKELSNSDEKNYVKEKDIANDDERETVKIKELTNSDEKKLALKKELGKNNGTKTTTEKSMFNEEEYYDP